MIGKTEEISEGLLLWHYGVPYEVNTAILSRNDSFWERAESRLGVMSVVGSLHKKGGCLPAHLASHRSIKKINYFFN